MEVTEYTKKVMDSITKEYRKCSSSTVSEVVKEAALIARNHDLQDRIDAPTQSEARESDRGGPDSGSDELPGPTWPPSRL